MAKGDEKNNVLPKIKLINHSIIADTQTEIMTAFQSVVWKPIKARPKFVNLGFNLRAD